MIKEFEKDEAGRGRNQTTLPEQPKRTSRASVALITRTYEGQTQWLLQWNAKWQLMNVISRHKEEFDANYLTCLIREVHEELFVDLSAEELAQLQQELRENNTSYCRGTSAWQDKYIESVKLKPNSPYEYVDYSKSAKCWTKYVFYIYDVTLAAGAPPLSADVNEWVTQEEIAQGSTATGRPVSKTVTRILKWIEEMETDMVNQQAMRELKQLLGTTFPDEIEKMILFGSRVTGDAREYSDYDVLVIVNHEYDWKFKDRIYDTTYDINLKYDLFTDVHVISTGELDTIKGKLPFIEDALEHGVVL